MTYIIYLHAYDNFSKECWGFTLYILQGFIIIHKYMCILMLMIVHKCIFITYTYCQLYFIPKIIMYGLIL